MKAEYTKEQKIEYYFGKLKSALAAGGVAKTVFEAMYYAEQANWITQRLMKIINNIESEE